MTKYCTQCGNKLEPDAVFCGKCGNRVQVEPNADYSFPANDEQSSERDRANRDTPPRNNHESVYANSPKFKLPNKKTLISICCAVGGVILVLIVVLALPKGSSNGSSGLFGNRSNDIAPVIGENNSVDALSLSDYISEYNSELRRTVSTSSSSGTTASDSNYISCAKTLINKILKNPSTAEYNEAEVLETDAYGKAIVHLNVSAQNGFGGWVREDYYVCIKSYNPSDETFTYHPYLYYIDGDSYSLYDTLKSMNDFGVDLADVELEGLILDEAAFTRDGSLTISPVQTLDCYKAVFDYGIQFVYVDTNSNHVVSVQTAFNEASSSNIDECKKVVAAAVAAMTDTTMSTANENVAAVMNLSSMSPTSTPSHFSDGFVYDCGYGFSGVDIAVTLADEKNYKSGLYWSPNNEGMYYENLADQYAESADYDNAIVYYEQAEISGDKLLSAYYGKAEQSFAAGDLDTAGLYFGYAGSYKDAAVRVLEVFYSAGQGHEKNKDYESAAYSYSMAGDFSDAKAKCKECNYKQGELYMGNKQYLEASVCFENATDYNGAAEKYKEACYLCAEQQLLIGSTDTAATYFREAGDYKDAATRMQKYLYDKGIECLTNKDYLSAADAFKQISGYSDAADKYKEANFLYGEELLSQGNVETAKTYFYNAKGYRDADTRVQRYYYEAGENLLNSAEYLLAVDEYTLAGNYSDATTKVLECYYQYGNQQMDLNYISNGTKYLSMCRGYKDTDEILLSYYYGEASQAFDIFINAFPQKTFTSVVDNAYKDTVSKLALCEGYNDSELLTKTADKLYYAWTELQYLSGFKASLYEMTVSRNGSIITIDKNKFISGQSCALHLVYDISSDTFTASITHMFESSVRNSDDVKIICALIDLFTSLDELSDLNAAIANKANWSISQSQESFSTSYGGYSVVINTVNSGSYDLDCTITASK